MSEIENKMLQLGYTLPASVTPGGNYVPTVTVSSTGLVYTSGHVSQDSDGNLITGKLGDEVSVEEGYEAAKVTAVNLLGSLKSEVGDLDRIERIVKVLCMVNCVPEFAKQPAVANGASDLFVELFGDKGRHTRSAVGVAALPSNVCVEIEMIVQIVS